MIDKLKVFTGVIEKIPIINLIPMIGAMMSDFPELWEGIPKEKKQKLFESLVAAGTKAASEYAGKD